MKRLFTLATAVATVALTAPTASFNAEAQNNTDSPYLCSEHERTFRDSRSVGISLDALREVELATRTRCPNLNARVNQRLREPVRSNAPAQSSTPSSTSADLCRAHRSLWPVLQESGTVAQVEAFRGRVPEVCSELLSEVTETYNAIRRGGPRPQGPRATLSATTGTGPLQLDQVRAGSLTPQEARPDGRVWDDYQLTLAANQAVELRLNSEVFDAYLEIGTGAGEEFRPIASNDDGDDGLNSLVRYQATGAATYTVRARALGGRGTGDYRLEVRTVQLTPPPEPRRIAVGQARAGVLSEGEARAYDDGNRLYDLYSFEARAGQRIQLRMDAPEVANRLDTMLVVGRMQDGVFQRLTSNDDYGGSTNSFIQLLVPENGEYLVRAQAYSARGTGEYELRLDLAPDRAPPAPVNLPDRPNATVYLSRLTDEMPVVRNQTYYQDFAFRARQGRQYVIEVSSPSFDPAVEIGSGAGAAFQPLVASEEQSSGENSARVQFQPPRDGAYVLRARSYSESRTGEFEVTITETGAATPAQ